MKFFKTFYKSVAARTTFMVVLMLLIIMGIGSVWQMQHVTAVVGAEAFPLATLPSALLPHPTFQKLHQA